MMHSANITSFHKLLAHLRSIVGRRDRTDLNGALLLAAHAMLGTEQAALLRMIRHGQTIYVIPCARAVGDVLDVQDAYLLSPLQGTNIDAYPSYARCIKQAKVLHLDEDGKCRHIVPFYRHGEPYALLDLVCSHAFTEGETNVLEQLLGLFIDHLNLIDYAETDTLTGLLNRKTFDENLSRVLANAVDDEATPDGSRPRRRHARKEGVAHWLAVADIDHFKLVNDTHGHIIGDEVLILVARVMRESFRFDDQLFRFGGEEFVTVLQPATPTEAITVLDRFRRNIESHDFPIVGKVTLSLGFTRVDPMGTPTELVGRADQALYYAKKNGRNRLENYESLINGGHIAAACPPTIDKPKPELF